MSASSPGRRACVRNPTSDIPAVPRIHVALLVHAGRKLSINVLVGGRNSGVNGARFNVFKLAPYFFPSRFCMQYIDTQVLSIDCIHEFRTLQTVFSLA